jgi:hypothetical protein
MTLVNSVEAIALWCFVGFFFKCRLMLEKRWTLTLVSIFMWFMRYNMYVPKLCHKNVKAMYSFLCLNYRKR